MYMRWRHKCKQRRVLNIKRNGRTWVLALHDGQKHGHRPHPHPRHPIHMKPTNSYSQTAAFERALKKKGGEAETRRGGEGRTNEEDAERWVKSFWVFFGHFRPAGRDSAAAIFKTK